MRKPHVASAPLHRPSSVSALAVRLWAASATERSLEGVGRWRRGRSERNRRPQAASVQRSIRRRPTQPKLRIGVLYRLIASSAPTQSSTRHHYQLSLSKGASLSTAIAAGPDPLLLRSPARAYNARIVQDGHPLLLDTKVGSPADPDASIERLAVTARVREPINQPFAVIAGSYAPEGIRPNDDRVDRDRYGTT